MTAMPPSSTVPRGRRFATNVGSAASAGVADEWGLPLDHQNEEPISYGGNPLARCLVWLREQPPSPGDGWLVLAHEHHYVPKRGGGSDNREAPNSRSLLHMRGGTAAAAAAAARLAAMESGYTYEAVPASRFVQRILSSAAPLFANEVIHGACCLYVDLDVDLTLNPGLDCEALQSELIATLDALLVARCSTTTTNSGSAAAGAAADGAGPEWLVQDASKPSKFSRHLVCINSRAERSAVWAGIAAHAVQRMGARCVVRCKENRHNPSGEQPAVDFGVYQMPHNMRTLRSAKRGEPARAFALRNAPAVASLEEAAALIRRTFISLPPAVPPGTALGRGGVFFCTDAYSEAELQALRALHLHFDARGRVASSIEHFPAHTARDAGNEAALLSALVDALALPVRVRKLALNRARAELTVQTYSKDCGIKGARHTGGNHIFYLVLLRRNCYLQRCYTDCDQRAAPRFEFPPAAALIAERLGNLMDAVQPPPPPPTAAAAAAAPPPPPKAAGSAKVGQAGAALLLRKRARGV